ncbi:Putative oxidoreductase YncB [[Actinomadura] parvosata subsp. kistnae]|nr:Putative oxidoreductase YncB [Actinomadura parvosata subsp. kistnae]
MWVSAAAGAVGIIAGQIARQLGAAKGIGSAGGPDKVKKLVTDFGFDYKVRPIAEQLAEAAPDGIDVYVDNVGGDHLRAAIAALRDRGRIGMVGASPPTTPPSRCPTRTSSSIYLAGTPPCAAC